MFGNQLAVYGIPVDVFFIPILVFLFAEKNREQFYKERRNAVADSA